MAARAQTPSHDGYYGSAPLPGGDHAHLSRGDHSGLRSNSFSPGSAAGAPADYSIFADGGTQPMSYTSRFNEELDASQRGSSIVDGPPGGGLHRSDSQLSSYSSATISRGPGTTTLKKKASLSKKGSLRRSSSRRSLRAGSVRSLSQGAKEKYGVGGTENVNSAFYVPIPTNGSPTEELANRFQAWRKILKDLIMFFKDVQKSYETRSKLFMSAGNLIDNIAVPATFLESGGLADAKEILRDYHRQAVIEANKAREVENEVVQQLTSLRSDLQQKTKEIKSLSGDFKNSVDKEVESTRKAVRNLQESLGLVDVEPAAVSGKHDPFILRLQVDRQIEKQIDEENYLHRAYLNLENSGRELESIVVGEIQKAYNAYASILKREADEAYDTVEKLRAGPISMAKDHEWNSFVSGSSQLVDPRVPMRTVEQIRYPGKDHPAAAEVRSGMLERKSKYLKSYTPGWYVLSPTHLHEFRSADGIAYQTPVMSLYLPEQKLGSHSQPTSSSYKFMLKGRQTGSMHRGHAWVFRAESYDTMRAWFDDIANLVNKTGEARNAFVMHRYSDGHHLLSQNTTAAAPSNSFSGGGGTRGRRSSTGYYRTNSSMSSDGGVMDDDEEEDGAVRTAYSFPQQQQQQAAQDDNVTHPHPGGQALHQQQQEQRQEEEQHIDNRQHIQTTPTVTRSMNINTTTTTTTTANNDIEPPPSGVPDAENQDRGRRPPPYQAHPNTENTNDETETSRKRTATVSTATTTTQFSTTIPSSAESPPTPPDANLNVDVDEEGKAIPKMQTRTSTIDLLAIPGKYPSPTMASS